MIKIVVDTENELNIVRRVLRTEACSHTPSQTCQNHGRHDLTLCAECVDRYHNMKVKLYKNEIVEIPEEISV